MRHVFAALFALLIVACPIQAFAQEVIGRWSGSTDWPGTQYDASAAWWDFRSDGSFADNFGQGGQWSRSGAAVTWRYAAGSRATYNATLAGNRLTGTMSDGVMSGTFALTSSAAAAPAATPAPAGPTQIDIQVCNQTGRDIFAAVIYRQVGGTQWRSEGWFRTNNGACRTIAATDNLTFYLYAEEVGDGGSRFWGRGDIEHCVTRPGPYNEPIERTGMSCRTNQDLVDFTAVTAERYGVYTWTLEP